jgi:hypothetical protein
MGKLKCSAHLGKCQKELNRIELGEWNNTIRGENASRDAI